MAPSTDIGSSPGVIEGFFGRPWSWSDRAGYAGFLKEIGFDFYVYAPKADPHLRRRWREPLPAPSVEALSATAAAFRKAGLAFGIGLSPFEIYLEPEPDSSAVLRAKVAQINEIDPDILCLLFDDMRGDLPGLAGRQAAVLASIAELSRARRFIFCPTYYSQDPVLETVFGPMPKGYLADLGRLLDPEVGIFWTGPRVCSDALPPGHLEEIAGQLRRKPVLWDNLLANDGAKTSNFLHLRGVRDRPAGLRDGLAGHAVNPMNQAWLSRIPILTLSESYALGARYDPKRSFEAACRRLCGEALGSQIAADAALFRDRGLAGIAEDRRRELIEIYAHFAGDPYAEELRAWLEGAYEFDPACLTD